MLDSSVPIEIEVKDNFLLITTPDAKTPVFFDNLQISQANSGQSPVYLDRIEPYWRYTLYSQEVQNDLVFHVTKINGEAPVSTDQIFNVLLSALGGV